MTRDYDIMLWVCGALAALIVFVIVMAIRSDNENFHRFMTQCQTDHKEYECYAMWRAGESHVTAVPVVVPVGGR